MYLSPWNLHKETICEPEELEIEKLLSSPLDSESFSEFSCLLPKNVPQPEGPVYRRNFDDGKAKNKQQEDVANLLEERTKKIFEKLNHCIKPNGLIDITKLAYSFNFEIVEHKGLPELLNGMITCDINGNQMAINNNLSKESKRYSIAYLLSTYLLYYQNQEFFSFKHLESDEDLDASNMARLLLIPESILKTICPDYDEDTQWLAEMFEVPYTVMEQRIKEIKISKGSVLIKKLTQLNNTSNK